MYAAKPFALNCSRQRSFSTVEEASEYLFHETGYEMAPEDWIYLGKLVEVDEDGSERMPESIFVAKKQRMVKIDLNSLL